MPVWQSPRQHFKTKNDGGNELTRRLQYAFMSRLRLPTQRRHPLPQPRTKLSAVFLCARLIDMSKYSSRRCQIQGEFGDVIKFDSVMERKRYILLRQYEQAGVIRALELQPRFTLLEKFESNGIKHRAIIYVADFRFFMDGKDIVEDVKGMETKEYLLKRKILLSRRDNNAFGGQFIFKELRLKHNAWEATEL